MLLGRQASLRYSCIDAFVRLSSFEHGRDVTYHHVWQGIMTWSPVVRHQYPLQASAFALLTAPLVRFLTPRIGWRSSITNVRFHRIRLQPGKASQMFNQQQCRSLVTISALRDTPNSHENIGDSVSVQ